MERREFRDLASPEEARATVRSLALEGGIDRVPLADALGRVLVARIDADLDVPGFDRASLDGYALRARDTVGASEADPVRLTVVGAVHAGDEPDRGLDAGEALEISTGAVMPPGADAMVPVERTDRVDRASTGEERDEGVRDDAVLVRTAVAPGENVMYAGADVAAGERALGPGTELTPREIGLLSALGVEDVPVRSRPRVGIVSTGDELVRPGGDLRSERGEIYDVNSAAIAAAVEDAGGDAVCYPHAGDDREELERVLREAAADCDLVCSSGSTSASAVDVIYRVIEDEGNLLLHGVSVKPGKPMLVGRLPDAAYVGLPGYPVSAMTVFRTFVAPAIREAAGRPEPEAATVEGRLAVEERSEEGRLRLASVGLVRAGPSESVGNPAGEPADAMGGAADDDRDLLVYPVDKGSGATTSLAHADGVVEIGPDTDYLAAGERVTVRLFSPDIRPPALLGVGEADPDVSRALDGLERPRYLSIGSRPAIRRLREGVPDVAVLAGPVDRDRAGDATTLAEWPREWGLVVPAGDPADLEGLADLVDRDCRLANRTPDSGLRRSLDAALEHLAADRGLESAALSERIDGYGVALRGLESPARRVVDGEADAGLGLRATADRLDLGFVSLGEQPVRVLANPDRLEKPGVRALERALASRTGGD